MLGLLATRSEALEISSWDSLDEDRSNLAQMDDDDPSWSIFSDELPWSLRFWCSAEPRFRFDAPDSLPFFSTLFCLHTRCYVMFYIYTSLFHHRDSENKPNNKTRMTRTTQKIIVMFFFYSIHCGHKNATTSFDCRPLYRM